MSVAIAPRIGDSIASIEEDRHNAWVGAEAFRSFALWRTPAGWRPSATGRGSGVAPLMSGTLKPGPPLLGGEGVSQIDRHRDGVGTD